MKIRSLFLMGLLACGTLPTSGDDGGGADASDDATVSDGVAPTDVASPDSGVDATADVISDAAMPKPDAPFVDLDAASAPWVVDFGAGGILGVAVDSQQNVVAAGYTGSSSYRNFFLEKLDAGGSQVWKKEVGSASTVNHVANAVAIDGAGNVYATGYVGDTVDLGGGPMGPGYFVVKYDAAGTFQWAFGPFNNSVFTKLATKSNGNVIVAGVINGSENYGGGALVPNGTSDAVLVELTPTKSFVRAAEWGGLGDQVISALALDYADDIFVGGNFESTIDFGGGPMTGPQPGTGHNMFIAKLDSSWGYLAQKQLQSSSSSDQLPSISTDWEGALFVVVRAYGTVNLGGGTLTPFGSDDVVFAKLDPSLGHVFSKIYGNLYSQTVLAVAADPTGGAAVSGGYGSTLDFGLGSLPAAPTTDQGLFLAQFSGDGGALADYGSGAQLGFGQAMAFVTWPDFVVGGYCYGTIVLPGGTLTCSSSGHGYVARLKP